MTPKFLHISERHNRDSILKIGLLPSKIKLEHHLNFFRNKEYISRDTDKILYMWEDSVQNEKFIKDMIYCKVWIQPRNNLYDGENSMDPLLNLCPYDSMLYDVYLIHNSAELSRTDGELHRHVQEPSDDPISTCFGMNGIYAHDDKLLGLSKGESNIEIIGEAKFELEKYNNICIDILK